MKHKKLFVSLTVIFSVIIFLSVFLMIWFFGDINKVFDKSFRQEFEIQGLDDGAVPQGMGTYSATYEAIDEDGKTVNRTQQYFLVSAYMIDGSPSRIYVTGEDTGYAGYVTMKNVDGSDYLGHCGGIATNGNTLWVTGESQVYVAKASEDYKSKNILREIVEKASNPEKGTSIQFTTSFSANCNASFCYYYDDSRYSSVTYDRLYVGEFYRKGNYETAEKHRITTPNGYKNTAFMYEYSVSSTTQTGLINISNSAVKEINGDKESSQVPKIQKIFSIPEKIQGVAFSGRKGHGTNDGMMVLSQSYGLANSHLLCFDWAKINNTSDTYVNLNTQSFTYENVYKTFGASKIPYTDSSIKVYFADKNDSEMFVNDYSIPSMSEGMCVVTPTGSNSAASLRVYVLFESAGKKYNKFVRRQLKNVYSFIPHLK